MEVKVKGRTAEPQDSEDSDDNKIVQIIHQSVKDFLLSNNFAGCITDRIIPSEAHAKLASVCITYLTFPEFNTTPLNYLEMPFLQYATVNWESHAPRAYPLTIEAPTQMHKLNWPKTQHWNTWHGLSRGYTSAERWYYGSSSHRSETWPLFRYEILDCRRAAGELRWF